ncbi:Isochorismatase hydrolase [Pleomassaria siparia CBS 279.74]|uniref:Isochorismatase hydrolase n=1 Tax=Pleomassaria siparia CBS 279.74 TaxID=1314801 RepID=A0A6G1JVW9_9PLEO|nr:Isochorismatase hydrolase [Pleomassaria siparia CBS 279.74]
MAAYEIIPSRTALFLLDLQVVRTQKNPSLEALMTHTSSIIQKLRSKGITIAHCRVAFTPSEMESIPDTNATFSQAKKDSSHAALFNMDSPMSAFHTAVTPDDVDIVVRKNRVGPFLNAPQDVHGIFKERGIDTLILGGISTGGAVLSTVVQAADLDYRLFVLEDACKDCSEETHGFLMDFFAKRATVINSEQLETFIK